MKVRRRGPSALRHLLGSEEPRQHDRLHSAYFFPITSPPNFLVNVVPPPNSKGNLDVTDHYPAMDFLAQLPSTCEPQVGCLGTFHFTIHRVKANVPN